MTNFSYPSKFTCPCCDLTYRYVKKFSDKGVMQYYYADNLLAQKKYLSDSKSFEAMGCSLYYYGQIKETEFGGHFVVCGNPRCQTNICLDNFANDFSSVAGQIQPGNLG